MSKESAMALLTGTPVQLPPSTAGFAAPQQQFTTASVLEPPKQPELQSTPFAQHAKKESELFKQKQQIKREMEQIAAEKEKIRNIQKQYDDYQATKAKDPIAALKMLGFNENDIMNYLANQQPEELTPEQKAVQAAEAAAEAKIKAFEESQTKRQKEEQERADQSLIQGYRKEVSKIVSTDPEFEYCNFHGSAAEDLIYETVLAVVDQSKGQEIITPREAAKLVEEFYEERDKEMTQKIRKRTPVSQEQAAQVPNQPVRTRTLSPSQAPSEQPKPTITRSRTLHNGATSTVASTRHVRNETREQKRERLMDRLRNGG